MITRWTSVLSADRMRPLRTSDLTMTIRELSRGGSESECRVPDEINLVLSGQPLSVGEQTVQVRPSIYLATQNHCRDRKGQRSESEIPLVFRRQLLPGNVMSQGKITTGSSKGISCR